MAYKPRSKIQCICPAASWLKKVGVGAGSCSFSTDASNFRQKRYDCLEVQFDPYISQNGDFSPKFCILDENISARTIFSDRLKFRGGDCPPLLPCHDARWCKCQWICRLAYARQGCRRNRQRCSRELPSRSVSALWHITRIPRSTWCSHPADPSCSSHTCMSLAGSMASDSVQCGQFSMYPCGQFYRQTRVPC